MQYKLISKLARLLGIHTATRPDIINSVWQYIKVDIGCSYSLIFDDGMPTPLKTGIKFHFYIYLLSSSKKALISSMLLFPAANLIGKQACF